MRRLFLIFGLIAALFAGWTPVAASLHVAATTSLHAGHTDTNEQQGHGGAKHAVAHPLLCSACFALAAETQHIAPARSRPAHQVAIEAVLAGGEVLPLLPPPRGQTF